jgi:D-3-phosphoglycerate dehydrogenase / 2-oxoglutarate reductase
MSCKVLVFGKINHAGLERLKDDGRFEVVEHADRAPDRIAAAADADAIVVKMTAIDEALLAAAPALKFVARHGLGYDTVDVAALTRRGIPLALTGDVNSGAVAEHTLALVLAIAKRLCPYDAAVRRGDFAVRDSYSAFELQGRTILLIGYGRIGRKVGRLARAFGMQVLVRDPFVTADQIADKATLVDDLHHGLAAADVVSIHAPRSPDGAYLLDAGSFDVIKPGAMVINVARGGLVDEAALLRALDEGRVAGAGLDVFEREPPTPDDPLLRHPKVLLSPHCAAYTRESSSLMALACADNVIGFFDGRLDPSLVVNPETLEGDRPKERERC